MAEHRAGARDADGVGAGGVTVSTRPSLEARFVQRLEELRETDRAALAVLRRNAGSSLAGSRGVFGLFFRLLPENVGRSEEIFFLVATLFALNDKPAPEGDFGASMAALRMQSESAALDRRMTILLDSDFDWLDNGRMQPGELGFRLRQAVRLLNGRDVGVNWKKLLEDLQWWSHPDAWVRKRWARSYFGRQNASETEGGSHNVD